MVKNNKNHVGQAASLSYVVFRMACLCDTMAHQRATTVKPCVAWRLVQQSNVERPLRLAQQQCADGAEQQQWFPCVEYLALPEFAGLSLAERL